MIEIRSDIIKIIVKSIWKNKWFIILFTCAGIFLSLLATEFIKDSLNYSATASICVAVTPEQAKTGVTSNPNYLNILTKYSDVVTSRKVSEQVSNRLKDQNEKLTPEKIKSMISYKINKSSYIMEITVSSVSKEHTTDIANAVAEEYIKTVSGISSDYSLKVLDVAQRVVISSNNIRNKIRMAVTIAFFAVSILFVLAKALFDDKVKFVSQCVDDNDEILAIIPSI